MEESNNDAANAYHLHTENGGGDGDDNGGGAYSSSGEIPMQTLLVANPGDVPGGIAKTYSGASVGSGVSAGSGVAVQRYLAALQTTGAAAGAAGGTGGAPGPTPARTAALSPTSTHISALTSRSLSPAPPTPQQQQQPAGVGVAAQQNHPKEDGVPTPNTKNASTQLPFVLGENPCLKIPHGTTSHQGGGGDNSHNSNLMNLNLINMAKTKMKKRLNKSNAAAAADNNAAAAVDVEESIVVILKSYYVSHSVRYPPLLKSGKPIELEQLSSTTWYEIQTQLEPLLTKHLFLPKSYILVPILCLISSIIWLLLYAIVNAVFGNNSNGSSDNDANQGENGQYYYQNNNNANNGNDDQGYNNYNNYYGNNNNNNNNNGANGYGYDTETSEEETSSAFATVVWMGMYFVVLGFVWFTISRWVEKRNRPVDEELREVCMELSRYKTQSEGYRLEYHKTGSNTLHQFDQNENPLLTCCNSQGGGVFATRVLRFVPLPIPRKISVPTKNAAAAATTTAGGGADPGKLDIEVPQQQQQQQQQGGNNNAVDIDVVDADVQRQSSYISANDESTQNSDFPTLQSLSYSLDFAPFPKSDVLLENLSSLLFILVIVQFVHSLQ